MSLSSKPRALILFAALATAAMLFAVVFAGQAKAGGNTIVNDGTADPGSANSDCNTTEASTIQAGVDAAAAGGTVFVCPGTYNENVSINKNLTLLSTDGRADTTIQATSPSGSAGTVVVTNNTTDVQIGGEGQGFTIIGVDNNSPGIESAALYFQGSHSGASILDNEIRANGDLGLLTEFGATISSFAISGNEFSGKTFAGDNPGIGNQFVVANVPRPLVTMGNGASQLPAATNVTFTNNEITGIAGGMTAETTPQQSGNTLVSLDVADSTISGNIFAGETNRFSGALRVRQSGTDIEDNTFDGSRMEGTATRLITAQNGPSIVGNNLDSKDGATVGIIIEAASTTTPPSAPTINFNRIVNAASGTAIFNSTAGAVNAENNWFGCNEGPASAPSNGCDTTSNTGSGSIDADPNLVMDITADPDTINVNGGTSDITSSFDQNSDEADVAPLFPDDVEVLFDTDLGTVDPPSDLTLNALAETTLTSGNQVGTATVTASLDAETVDTPVEIVGGEGVPPACTIVGTEEDDNIVGTPGDDVICALGGDDVVRGNGGNDRIFGGGGEDFLIGSDGNDIISGGMENDVIRGFGGDDRLDGGEGNDNILGGDGGDIITGGLGMDTLNGNGGGDRVLGEEGNDRLAGGDGNDLLDGGDGRDVLTGNDGNDRILGGASNDVLVAGEGIDRLFGQDGNDRLNTLDEDGNETGPIDVADGGLNFDICATDPRDREIDCER